MTSSVHFRFKSARQFETLPFEGDFLKVADLKVAIVARKKLNFGEGFDLEISDAATNEVYHDENALVQKNTSVIVRRIPGLKPGGILSHQDMAAKNERYAEKNPTDPPDRLASVEHPANDLPKTIEGADEAERINSLISQASSAVVDLFPPPPPRGRYGSRAPHRAARGGRGGRPGRGARQAFQGAGSAAFGANMYPDRAPRPSANYVCHRCNQPGHWIDQCPTNGDPTYDKIKVRAPTGIPRSMLRQVDAPESGTGLQDSSGQFVTLQPNEEEFARQTVGLRLSQAAAAAIGKDVDSSADPTSKSAAGSSVASRDPSASPQEADLDITKKIMTEPLDRPSTTAAKSPAETGQEGSNNGAKSPADTGHDGASCPPQDPSKVAKQDDTSVSKIEPDIAKANGIHPAGGVGDARHINKDIVPARRGPKPPPARMPLPGMPMPGAPPPGFPPMGMPPFPPGLPPPPPHILMAMAAAAASGQGGMPPLPPGLVPPGMPLPFPPPVGSADKSDGPTELSAAQRQGFQNFMAMMHGQAPPPTSGSDKQSGSVDNDRGISERKEKPEHNGETGTEPQRSPDVSKSQGIPVAKEKGGLAADMDPDRGLEHPSSEKIESPPISKSESRLPDGRSDTRREREERRKRDSYENDKEESLDQRHVQESRFSRRSHESNHSPRERSPLRHRQSPIRERRHSPLRRRDRILRGDSRDGPLRDSDISSQGRGYEESGRRDLRRGREDAVGLEQFVDGLDESKKRRRSPPRDRMRRDSRERSLSPPRARREGIARPPRDAVRRGRSPLGRDRFSDHRDGLPPSPSRSRRERMRGPSPRDRLDKQEYRYRSRSPLDVSRYERVHRDRDTHRQRRHEQSRGSHSPVRLNGQPEFRRLDVDPLDRRPRGEDRGDYKRRGILRPDGLDRPAEYPESERMQRLERKDFDAHVSKAGKEALGLDEESRGDVDFRDRSPRRGRIRDDKRPRRERGAPALEDLRVSKRARRDRSPERHEASREEQKDRRSVHDRLGQAPDKRRGRRSVHDRLG